MAKNTIAKVVSAGSRKRQVIVVTTHVDGSKSSQTFHQKAEKGKWLPFIQGVENDVLKSKI